MSILVPMTNRLDRDLAETRPMAAARGGRRLAVIGCLLTVTISGCKKEARDSIATTPPPVVEASRSPRPSATPSPDSTPSPPPPPRVSTLSGGLESGWLTIEQVSDDQKTAWAEGRVEDGEKLIIDTANVSRFTLDLSRVTLNWDRRIVLRIDGFNRELTRKNYPILKYRRTSTGGWRLEEKEP